MHGVDAATLPAGATPNFPDLPLRLRPMLATARSSLIESRNALRPPRWPFHDARSPKCQLQSSVALSL